MKYCICTGEGHREVIKNKSQESGRGDKLGMDTLEISESSHNVSAHFIIILIRLLIVLHTFCIQKNVKINPMTSEQMQACRSKSLIK